MRTFRLAMWICLGFGLAPAPADAAFTQIVSFGDSLSDTGNVFRYSNGPVWVEYLATSLGVPAPTPSLTGGTNYSYGGAQTDLSGVSPATTPNIGTQVTTFLSGHTLNASQLVTIWGGTNDFQNNNSIDPALIVSNISTEITQLAAAGGKNFAVPNLAPVGEEPGLSGLSAAARTQLDNATQVYNTELAAALGQLRTSLGVNIYLVDVNGLYAAIRKDPMAFGFTDVTHGALDVPGRDPTGFLYLDGVHPTTAAHALIANRALAAITAVPEPSSVLLLATAGACLAVPGARAWRRSFKAWGCATPR